MARKRMQWILPGIIVMIAAGFFLKQVVTARSLDTTRAAAEQVSAEVTQGPLLITVKVDGTVSPQDQVILRNEVEGETRILNIVDEGASVKEGDVLVELDHSALLDERVEQEIALKTTQAAYVSAKENLEVVRNQGRSDIAAAELALQFAELDKSKYLEGDYPMLLKDAETQIALAEGQAKRAEDQLEGSQRLAQKNFITQTELEADQLEATQTKLDLELKRDEKNLLENYTRKRELDQLESDVRQATMALERIKRSAKADEVRAEADLAAAEAEYLHAKSRVEKLTSQIEKSTIKAPRDGLVVYATSAHSRGFRREEPLDEGQIVRERQELIYLPTADNFRVDAQVQEASRAKVVPGQPVHMVMEALPGREFFGRVNTVDMLPDASMRFMNPDLRVYNLTIKLEGDTDSLRTGMACTAEIIVSQLEDVLSVPVQTVVRRNGQETVYVLEEDRYVPRPVEVGPDNGTRIVITSGLKKGERVSVMPSLDNTEMNLDSGDERLRSMKQEQAAGAAN